MRSNLLEGKVRHHRARPVAYALEHDVWYAAIDLAELPELDRRLRLFGRNRRALAAFRDADHLPVPAADVDAGVRDHLRAEGEDPDGWRITLVTNLRVLGYVFNPASFFLCRDAAGLLRLVVVEVHNTFGERHLYTLRPDGDAVVRAGPSKPAASKATGVGPATDRPFTAGMGKAFFVSPFISVDGRYAVHIRDGEDGLRLAISLRQGAELVISTSLVLRRRPLTDRSLVRMLVRYPLVTQKTIVMIHYHAVRLWLKGAPFFRHSQAARAHGGRPAEEATR
jgi:DUF1365 family protein